jgi:adenylate cyclase
MTTTRRLAAIMAADVAGFSAAMERDEEGTFAQVQELRRKIVEPKIAEHQGRLIKTTGDGFLAEFASPIAATRAALAIQAETASGSLRLRIGLNLGDVIVEESGDVYGEGVNVAARLEALADPGGILISTKVHSEVEGKVEAEFEDRGEQQVKNIAKPVRVYAVRLASVPGATASPVISEAKLLPLPDKPSIAVLPFQNMSGDPEQEYFADGVVEDIITALSRKKGLFVIARNSSFSYKGKQVDIRQVGRELGVRYVLEGSVRRAGQRVRVTGQLIEAGAGRHLWANRYDEALDDIFDLQDRITTEVIGEIAPEIERAEIDRAVRKPTSNLTAYDFYLRGLAASHVRPITRASTQESCDYLQRAIDLDRNFASALAYLAVIGSRRQLNGWADDPAANARQCVTMARSALAIDRTDPDVLINASWPIGYLGRLIEEASSLLEEGLRIDPNHALGWTWNALFNVHLGNHDLALEHVERALRLSPRDAQRNIMLIALAMILFYKGRLEEATARAEEALRGEPNHLGMHRVAISGYALAGRIDEARAAAARLLALDPGHTISGLLAISVLRRPEDLALLVKGLRLAGLPE